MYSIVFGCLNLPGTLYERRFKLKLALNLSRSWWLRPGRVQSARLELALHAICRQPGELGEEQGLLALSLKASAP